MNAQKTVAGLVVMLVLGLAMLSVRAQGGLVTVKIVINGTGTGGVTSVPPGTVDCSSSCSVEVPAATNLTLHATGSGGSNFLMWTGACADKLDCNLTTASAAKTVTATFNAARVQLKLALLGGGTGKITISPPNDPNFACTRDSKNCLQTFPKGTVVRLKAVADSGSLFSAWNGPATHSCDGAAHECEFTLNESVELTAAFGWAVPHTTLQVTTSGSTGAVGGRIFSTMPEGLIDCGPTCQASIPTNQAVKLLAVPDANSSLAGWSDENGQFISQFCSTEVTCDLPTGAGGGVRASFKANPLGPVPKAFFVAASPPDAGYFEINPKPDCTNSGCSNYTSPQPISIQAFNKAGYEFKNWSGKTGFPCKQTGTYNSSCSFYLNSIYDVTANYVTVASISADLQTSLQAPVSVAPLEEFHVTATLFNAGPVEASDAALTLNLPVGVNLVSADSTAGSCQGGTYFSCAVTGLPSGSSITMQLTLRAPSNAGKLQWNASGGSPTPSTILGNNFAKATTEVTGGVPLSLSAAKSAPSPADGTALKGARQVPILAFKLTPSGADAFELRGIYLKSSGTGKDNVDLGDVQLYQDTNQNAQVDAGEPLLSTNGFETDNGFVSLNVNLGSAIASAGSGYLVTVNLNTTLATQPFSSLGLGLAGLALLSLTRRRSRRWALGLLLGALVSCPNPPPVQDPPPIQDSRTYQISLIEASVTASIQTIAVTGLPLTGATISVAK